jgi:hypothetical protein
MASEGRSSQCRLLDATIDRDSGWILLGCLCLNDWSAIPKTLPTCIDFTIWHDCLIESGMTQVCPFEIGIGEIGIA